MNQSYSGAPTDRRAWRSGNRLFPTPLLHGGSVRPTVLAPFGDPLLVLGRGRVALHQVPCRPTKWFQHLTLERDLIMRITHLALLLTALVTNGLSGQIAVPEIPDPTLPDIAMVRPDPTYGAVIVYNPIICQSVGLACGFFRAHEYGHVVLSHQFRDPRFYPAEREASADCWAAQNGRPQEILAAVQLFLAGGSSGNWAVYGNPVQRAERVRLCAMQAGRWMGRE